MDNQQPKNITIKSESYNLTYTLNDNESSASLTQVIGNEKILCDYIIIPRSINSNSKEYIIKSISQRISRYTPFKYIKFAIDSEIHTIEQQAFMSSALVIITIPPHVTRICEGTFINCPNLESVIFPPNSETRIIEKKAFYQAMIKKIIFPASLVELNDGWCFHTEKLTEIEVDPRNPRYSCLDGKFIIGKSKIEQENYDVFVFSVRNIDRVTIPSYIEVIGTHAFELCYQLQQVEIPANSKLREIRKFAFSCTSFASIMIPACLVNLNEGWCTGKSNIKHINIDPRNPRYMVYEDNFIIGKSNLQNAEYDCLNFARYDIKVAFIPKFIKQIDSYAFNACEQIQYIEFPDDSELQSIGKYAFCGGSLKRFSIPRHIKHIGKCAFHSCNYLQRFDIPSESELQALGKELFGFSKIQ